jgi:hypothetical protein
MGVGKMTSLAPYESKLSQLFIDRGPLDSDVHIFIKTQSILVVYFLKSLTNPKITLSDESLWANRNVILTELAKFYHLTPKKVNLDK